MSPLLADFVAKVENRTRPKISQELIFRRLAAAMLCSADMKLGGRFSEK
jgi:hypothetical protein